MEVKRMTVTCSACHTQFTKVLGSPEYRNVTQGLLALEAYCFNCTLTRITGERCPEEGDFNTARLVSGEMSDEDISALRSDLASVESYDPFEDEWDAAERWDKDTDRSYEEQACRKCGQIDDCTCYDYSLDGGADIADRSNPFVLGDGPREGDRILEDDDPDNK